MRLSPRHDDRPGMMGTVTTDQRIALEGVLVIRRVYIRLRAAGLPKDKDPKVLAANIIFLYRMGIEDEERLVELVPHIC